MQNWNTINIHNAKDRIVIDSNGRAHKVMLREGGWDISPHSGLAVWDAARFLNEMDATLLEFGGNDDSPI